MPRTLFGGRPTIDHTEGPDQFTIGDGAMIHLVYRKLEGGGDTMTVWKCDSAMHKYDRSARLYLFRMHGVFLQAEGDASITHPRDVQDASDKDELTIVFGSNTDPDVLNPGGHQWEVWDIRHRMWHECDQDLATTKLE